jgi:hypothetical protein
MFALPPAFLEGADMALYYFDLRDGEELALDEEGLELRTMRAVQEEAARALSGIAYDAMRLDAGNANTWQSRCATCTAL